MANTITVALEQKGPATSEATIRDHRVLIDRPEAKGGDDRGPMGGELLLAALGGCFCSNLLAAIRSREADISDVRIEVAGVLDGSPPRFEEVTLTVTAKHDDPALLEKLVTISERSCIVANTLRPAIRLKASVASS